jgi:hypothetical protein
VPIEVKTFCLLRIEIGYNRPMLSHRFFDGTAVCRDWGNTRMGKHPNRDVVLKQRKKCAVGARNRK